MTVTLLEDTLAVLTLGILCEEHGYSCECISGQLPHLVKKKFRRFRCNTEKYVRIGVPGLSTSSSSSTTGTSTTSLSHDSEKSTIRPATARSKSISSQVRRDPLRSRETENKNKNEDPNQVLRNPLRDIPERLEDFTENLVDEGVPSFRDAPASTSRESETAVPKEVEPGKHSVFAHFQRTKITRAPCGIRAGTAILRAESFW